MASSPGVGIGDRANKGARLAGVRVGNWLSLSRHSRYWTRRTCDKKGLRPSYVRHLLLGCGLRRSEVANLTMNTIQQRDNAGASGLTRQARRVRTIPMPAWTKKRESMHGRTSGRDGRAFVRPVNRGDQVLRGAHVREGRVANAEDVRLRAGLPDIAPHDLRRYAECRTMPHVVTGRTSARPLRWTIRHSLNASGKILRDANIR